MEWLINRFWRRRTIGAGLALFFGLQAFASEPEAQGPEHRYLLIVETSRAMSRRIEGVGQVLRELLASGLRGQAMPGDSLGIWTFNDEVFTGQMSAQPFSTASGPALAQRTLDFLKQQNYTGGSRLDKALPGILRVAQTSQRLTVIIISSGEHELEGTSWDPRLSQSYRDWKESLAKARLPMVTVLRALNGRITSGVATPAPWTIEVPPAPELPVAKSPPARPPLKTIVAHGPLASVTNVSVGPLILSGKKDRPASHTTNAPAVAAPEPEVPAIVARPVADPVVGDSSQVAPAESGSEPIAATVSGSGSQDRDLSRPVSAAPAALADSPAPEAIPPADATNHSDAAIAHSSAVDREAASERGSSDHIYWFTGMAVLVAAMAGFWIWRRTRRPRGQVSLITQSLDHSNSSQSVFR